MGNEKQDKRFQQLYKTKTGRKIFNTLSEVNQGKKPKSFTAVRLLEKYGLVKPIYKIRRYVDTGKKFRHFEGWMLTRKGRHYLKLWKNMLKKRR